MPTGWPDGTAPAAGGPTAETPTSKPRAARSRLRQVLQVRIWERQLQMPPLAGRPKAVAWARKVRHRLVTCAAQSGAAGAQPHCDDIHAAARSITTAAWWIDHRRLDPAALAAALEHSSRQPPLRRPNAGRIR